MEEMCAVPGCEDKKSETFEDTCARHGRKKAIRGIPQNDGVIDWLVVERLAEGSMEGSKGTWLERDIAAAVLLARGQGMRSVQDQLNVYVENRERGAELSVMSAALQAGTPYFGPVRPLPLPALLGRGQHRTRAIEGR